MPAADRRGARRPLRPAADALRRPRALHHSVAAGRAGADSRSTDRRPGAARRRRGDHGAADPHARHRRLPAGTAELGDRHLERRRGPERGDRAVRRRCHRAGDRLALDLLGQRPRRPGADPYRAAAIALLRVRESHGGHPRLDITGVALATTGLSAITWAIIRTDTAGWGSPQVVVPLAAGLAIVALFAFWERRTQHPMLSPEMFRRASFTAANGISFCLFAGLFGALFLMSQFFQTAQGRTPLQAGTQLLAWSATGVAAAPITGRLADRHGNRPFMLAGLLMQTAGLACVAIIARGQTPFWEMAPLLAIAGSGTAMVFPAVASVVMASVAPRQAGIASGTNNALRELGGVFGVAVLASVFSRPGAYGSPGMFVAGFRSALWIAVACSAVGIPLALSLKPTTAPGAAREGQAGHSSAEAQQAAGR